MRPFEPSKHVPNRRNQAYILAAPLTALANADARESESAVAPGRTAPPDRLKWLDGLRALAVLSVLVHHLVAGTARLADRAEYSRFSAISVWREGAHGVDLFFTISGFCLAFPTLRALAANGSAAFDVPAFYAKRITRILPPYWIALALFALTTLVLPALGVELPLSMSPGRVHVSDVLRQAFFLDNGTWLVNGSFWTLAVEFRWYLIFPLMLWLWVRAPRLLLTLLFAAAFAYVFTRTHSIDEGVLPAFLFGIVAAGLVVRRMYSWRTVALTGFAATLYAVFTQNATMMPDQFGHDNRGFFMQTNLGWHAAAFALVLATAKSNLLRRMFSWRPLTLVGAASYSIYLVHEPIIGITAGLFSTMPLAASLAISALAALASGFAFWAVVERPLLIPKRRSAIGRRIERPIAQVFERLRIPALINFATNTEPGPEDGPILNRPKRPPGPIRDPIVPETSA